MTLFATKHYVLRQVTLLDGPSLAQHINHRLIARNTSAIPFPYAVSDARKWIRQKQSEYRRRNTGQIGYIIDIQGQVVGAIDAKLVGSTANIGYWLAKRYWGQGIMTDVVKRFTRYLFQKRQVKRVEAEVFLANRASMRVVEKAGFKPAGESDEYFRSKKKVVRLRVYVKMKP